MNEQERLARRLNGALDVYAWFWRAFFWLIRLFGAVLIGIVVGTAVGTYWPGVGIVLGVIATFIAAARWCRTF